ncbi:sulfur carrier protein ThiS adenylyltransferase ThiF [Qiania dongpingensis]|uniref:Sulfur carrier protein ThiS adenylyltransferase ThiF n=1 Tax=Qiania dongpingensis TaxID=2763669 RepID=A0A7G9G565_9FIRM|nr:sulfur carrier protein ThiS adenylyltransferase ThiF [Qiania dongpingensis]QNM05947.1 sulfur carrier protein ThiS adenylyltransferase ThiF [Qiania dongpingensis]
MDDAEEEKLTREEIAAAVDSRFPENVRNRLREATVGIAGLGGLGSHIAIMLARSFVGHLLLVDFDRVDVSNLNRQAYGISHLGMEKTKALSQIIKGINPYLDVKIHTVRVDRENAGPLFEECPIVCEAFDRPEEKAMLVNTLLEKCPDTVVISGSGMAGYGSGNEIRAKKVMRRLYLCGDGKTDIADGIGLMAPRVNICAGQQANMAVRLILGEPMP